MSNPTMSEMLKSANSIDDKIHAKKQEQALNDARAKVQQLTPEKKKLKAKA